MPFKIIRNDITKVSCDAIVNTANHQIAIGKGTDSAIYNAAGKEKLLKARTQIGIIEYGKSAWTDSFDLKENGIKYIIHTVGTPYCDGKQGEVEILKRCYSSSLNLAKDLGCKSVAIPLLASGYYGFPGEIALQTAIDEISRFLLTNEIEVTLVVYDKKSYLISEKLFCDIQDFICENYDESEDEVFNDRHSFNGNLNFPDADEIQLKNAKNNFSQVFNSSAVTNILKDDESVTKPATDDVDDFITSSKDNLNFQNTLQKLIAQKNVENSAIYSKALIDRKFFSKIISHKNYVPKKMTVMALGLALELKLNEYEKFLATAGYAFMPSSKFDMIIKFCVMHEIYNLIEVDMILDSHGENCFACE